MVGQIIPWNFPPLMAAWKLAPVLAGQLPQRAQARRADPGHHHADDGSHQATSRPGVVNVVNGFGAEAGQALATSNRIQKLAFTGSTEVGAHIPRCAADKLIPPPWSSVASPPTSTSPT